MTSNKPKTRSWYDVQMAIAAIAMSLTLALWNLFAGPDHAQAVLPPVPTEAPVVALNPEPMPIVKIIFGSSAPQQTYLQPTGKNNKGGGGGGGSTKAS